MRRLAIVTSHPIQYQAPFFRALAAVTDLEVFFCHRQTADEQAAAGFGVAFDWDIPLLDGYRSTFLSNRSPRPDVSRFAGCDTPEIAAVLRSGGFDACLVSGWYLKSYWQAISACRSLGLRLMVRGDSHLGTRRSTFWTAAKYLPYRWLLGRIDAHLFVGVRNREYLAHYGVRDEALFFAPHFVDNAFFATGAGQARQAGDDAGLRAALGIPVGAFVFAFAGKLIGKKRPADFIRALAACQREDRNVWGLMIGDGGLAGELATLAQSLGTRVRFAGFRNQSEMPACLAAANALVLPSDGGETWGLAVNEAMAAGLPAVVSNAVGCAPDLVDERETGFSYPVGDIAALQAAMSTTVSLLRAAPERVRRAVTSRIERYSCDAAVRGTLAAMEAS